MTVIFNYFAGTCKVDYAHEGTGFPTWHRQFLLWFEWEIQGMLKVMSDPNYHRFRLHYWDWRGGKRADEIFRRDRLGQNDRGQVSGDLFDDGWNTICWYQTPNLMGTTCNPNIGTGPLRRCPLLESDPDPCRNNNPNWPTSTDVTDAISKSDYDSQSYNKWTSSKSFRSFMEGFVSDVTVEECKMNDLCMCDINGEESVENCNRMQLSQGETRRQLQRRLHNTVSYHWTQNRKL